MKVYIIKLVGVDIIPCWEHIYEVNCKRKFPCPLLLLCLLNVKALLKFCLDNTFCIIVYPATAKLLHYVFQRPGFSAITSFIQHLFQFVSCDICCLYNTLFASSVCLFRTRKMKCFFVYRPTSLQDN